LWESRNDLAFTDDSAKYDLSETDSKVLAILKDGEFVESAKSGDEVEILLDKTQFYGTQGGQVGDSGELKGIMQVNETNRIGCLIIHKGVLISSLHVWDDVIPSVNKQIRIQTARAHTAAHLLQAALRIVLNDDVEQRGSKVSSDSVRFDFSFGRAMTTDEIARTEKIINEWIASDMPVKTEEMTMDEAKSRGAMALFSEKYGDTVRVITAGEVSCELCGGTHITHTGEIKAAKINKEKSISSGIRRITMSVGDLA
jgi:alanyl-tRNA synthetase